MVSIILLHGLFMNKYSMKNLEKRFLSKGFNVINFEYNTITYKKEDALNELDETISCIDGDIFLVGHSMGGLIARLYQTKHKNPRIKGIVTLGTPHNGSLNAKLINSTKLSPILGTSGNSGIIKKIQDWNDACPLGTIIGNSNIGVNLLFSHFHKEKSPSDGTVFVEEAELKNATDKVILKVTHMQMLFSKSVFEQCLYFIQNNKFKHS